MKERFNKKKYETILKIAMILFAAIMIALIAGVVKFFNIALKKEAIEKEREERRFIDKDLIKFL